LEYTFGGKAGRTVKILDIFEIQLAILIHVQVMMPNATPSMSTASGELTQLTTAENEPVVSAIEG